MAPLLNITHHYFIYVNITTIPVWYKWNACSFENLSKTLGPMSVPAIITEGAKMFFGQ